MAECNELEFELPGFSGRKIEGNFEGGNVSSDGVLPDLICERCGRFSSAFESVMGADLLLNVRSLLDETSDQWWYPHTLIYSASRVLPLFVRAEQSDQFRTLAHLLGGGNKQELEQRFLGRLEKQQRFGRLFASSSEGPVSLKTLMNLDRWDTTN